MLLDTVVDFRIWTFNFFMADWEDMEDDAPIETGSLWETISKGSPPQAERTPRQKSKKQSPSKRQSPQKKKRGEPRLEKPSTIIVSPTKPISLVKRTKTKGKAAPLPKLIGHRQTYTQLLQWLQWKRAPKTHDPPPDAKERGAILLSGPVGNGKTLMVEKALQEVGYKPRVFSPSTIGSWSDLYNQVSSFVNFSPLFGEKCCGIVDHVDVLVKIGGTITSAHRSTMLYEKKHTMSDVFKLLKGLKPSQNPVIFIANSLNDEAIRKLGSDCFSLKTYGVGIPDMQRIALALNRNALSTFSRAIQDANGDARKLTTDISWACAGADRDIVLTSGRSIFDMTHYLLSKGGGGHAALPSHLTLMALDERLYDMIHHHYLIGLSKNPAEASCLSTTLCLAKEAKRGGFVKEGVADLSKALASWGIAVQRMAAGVKCPKVEYTKTQVLCKKVREGQAANHFLTKTFGSHDTEEFWMTIHLLQQMSFLTDEDWPDVYPHKEITSYDLPVGEE